jgi:hypothetical protein
MDRLIKPLRRTSPKIKLANAKIGLIPIAAAQKPMIASINAAFSMYLIIPDAIAALSTLTKAVNMKALKPVGNPPRGRYPWLAAAREARRSRQYL